MMNNGAENMDQVLHDGFLKESLDRVAKIWSQKSVYQK